MPDRLLVRVNEGAITIAACPIIWTSASGGEMQAVRGEAVYNPATGSKQRLFDEPEIGNLTLSTAFSTAYEVAFDRWYQQNKTTTNIVVVCTIKDIVYRFTNCSVVTANDFPGIDKDGQSGVTAKRIQLILAPGGRAPINP